MSAGNDRPSFPPIQFEDGILVDKTTIQDWSHDCTLSLHCAAARGKIDVVKRLLFKDNALCDDIDQFGKTALHWCSEYGHSDVVRQLLSASATVDPIANKYIATPLMRAALAGHAEVVRILLAAGAGARDRPCTGNRCRSLRRSTAVQYAGKSGEWRNTALHYAARGGQVEVVIILLGAGFDKCQKNMAGLMPVELAARMPSLATSPISSNVRAATTFRLLPKDRAGPLVHSYVKSVMEEFPTVKGLAEGGAFLGWQDDIGDSPLHLAAHFHHVRITEALLQAGAETDLRNHRGGSPLHVAACTGCLPIVSMLLKEGADTESRMVNGRSPLHLAVINDNPEVVKALLQAGAYVEHRDHSRGQTPISEAAEYGFAHMINILLEARKGESPVDVETRSSAGLTPLHFACRFNSLKSVKALLSAGADPDAVDVAAATVASRLGSLAIKSTIVHSVQSTRRSSIGGKDELGVVVSCGDCKKSKQPVADDVIGFGDPSNWAESPQTMFMGETSLDSSRRRNPISAARIRVLLRRARKGKAWRRRGWLVMLAARLEVNKKRDYSVVDFHTHRNLAGSSNAGIIVTKISKDEGDRWRIQGPATRACMDCEADTDDGTEQIMGRAETEDNEEEEPMDIDDDPCKTSVRSMFEWGERVSGRVGNSAWGIKRRMYGGLSTKSRHESISAYARACPENGSVKNGFAVGEKNNQNDDGTPAATPCCARMGDRYGDNDLDEKLFGKALDDMVGSALIQRLVALAGVEMGVFRRVVRFI